MDNHEGEVYGAEISKGTQSQGGEDLLMFPRWDLKERGVGINQAKKNQEERSKQRESTDKGPAECDLGREGVQ